MSDEQGFYSEIIRERDTLRAKVAELEASVCERSSLIMELQHGIMTRDGTIQELNEHLSSVRASATKQELCSPEKEKSSL